MHMTANKSILGHLAALTSVLVWGTTFVSTKVLLDDFKPVELLFFRFILGFIALSLAYPRPMKRPGRKLELLYALAGLCGVTLYFLMENIALTYTLASNVGVIVSVAPIFTALLAHFLLEGEKLRPRFILGFLVAMAGVALISTNGSRVLALNPKGDLLALSAAGVWAVYSIALRHLSQSGPHIIQVTRRVFFYGLVFTVPFLVPFGFEWRLERFTDPVHLANILFLGLMASALCYATWSTGVKLLGAVKSSAYIFLVPVVTIITSILFLSERLTLASGLGTLLTLSGLWLSERRKPGRRPAREAARELPQEG